MGSRWGVLWAGIKGFFTPGTSMFQEIVRYGLDILNNLMSGDDVATRVLRIAGTSRWVLDLLVKYQDWCPMKWQPHFIATIGAVRAVVDAFADAKITEDEARNVTVQFQVAYASWMAD